MKKVIYFVITILFLCTTVCSCSKASDIKTTIIKVDSKEYSTFDEMYDDADIIIKGKIVEISIDRVSDIVPLNDEQSNNSNKNGCPCANLNQEFVDNKKITTIYKVQLDEVYKGEIVDEEFISVKRVGGKLDEEELILDGAPKLKNNKSYIFFLNKYCRLVNLHQSIYKVDRDNSIEPIASGFDIAENDLTK